MSSYVVEDDTINRIVNYIACARMEDYERRELLAPLVTACPRLVPNDITLAVEEDVRWGLGQCMREMNEAAYEARYGKSDKYVAPPFIYRYDGLKHVMGGPVAAYKALQCFLYQCHEGNVPDWPLYKALREIQDALARRIVESTDAYEAASWG